MGTNFNYDDTSHQVIFDHVNGGSGSESLQQASQAWLRLSDDVGVTCKSYAQSAISTILATRQGAAAEASAAAVGAILPWMDDVTQVASAAAQRTQEQADYWVTAKNSIPPVPPTAKSVGFFSDPGEWAAEKMDWFPGVTSDEEKAQQRQQDAAEQARQAMRVYQANSNGNVDSAPAFTAPQALDGSVSSLPLTSSSIGAAAPLSAMGGGGAPARLMATYQPAVHQPAAHQPAAHRPATNPPAATVSQLAPNRAAGRPANVAPGWAGNPALNEGVAFGPPAATAGFGDRVTSRGGPAGTRFSGVGRRAGAALAAFGPRPSTEFGPRPTASPQSAMEEFASARDGTGTARGTAGSPGYGQPFAGTSQSGEQDREHRSKYLLHDDSNAIVGDLPPTAPPVIGADY